MKMIRTAVFAFFALACATIIAPADADTVVVRAGRMLDVEQGIYLADRAIRIEDGRVASITPWTAGSRTGGRLIDWSAYTVLPGLIDLHTHLVGDISSADVAAPLSSSAARDALMGAAHARATLDAGFTTVRDVGTYRAFVDVALRNAINAGQVEGPRMFVAGAYVTAPGGGGEVTGLPEGTVVPDEMRRGVASNEAEVRQRVREILAGGADLIKVIATGAVFTSGTTPSKPEFTEQEIRAAVEEAAKRGTFVAAHAHGAEGIKNAVRAGVRTVEHGSFLDDEGIALMVKHGTWLVADIYNGDYTEEVGTRDGWPEEIMRKNRETTDHAARQLRQGGHGGGADRIRHGLGHLPARRQCTPVRLHGQIRHDPARRDPRRDPERRRLARPLPGARLHRAGQVRRPDRHQGRSAREHRTDAPRVRRHQGGPPGPPGGRAMSNRQLGLGMATALVVGNTIGMGIFMQPAALAPFGLNALTGWAAVIIGCVCLALTFAALARKLPQADGPFGYVRSTLGESLAFPALWSYWISCWVTLPVLAIGTVGYFLNVFPAARSIPPAVIAVSFMWIFVGVNLLGIKCGGRVQVVTSLLKIVPLVLIMVVGSFSILANPGEYTPNLPTTPLTMHLSMGAAAVALYAMLGFESAAVAAGRVKDPERTIPRATLIGTLIVAAFYVAIVAIGMLVVPQATLATSDAPAVTIVDHLLGPGNGRWISLFVVISGLGCLNGWTMLSSELTRTLAANHLLPPVLGEDNRFGAPWASLLLAGALATFVGLMNYSATLVGAFTKLSLIVSAANLPLYVCCSVALFVMLRKSPAGLSPLLWIAGAGGVAFAAFAFFGVGWEAFIWALALALAGVPIYYWMRGRRASAPTPAA